MSEAFTIKQVAYHRNGVAGDGFTVAIVEREGHRFLAIDFYDIESDKEDGRGELRGAFAVLDLDEAANGNIYMHPLIDEQGNDVPGTGNNAWRGDELAGEWRSAIRAALDEQGHVQMQWLRARYESKPDPAWYDMRTPQERAETDPFAIFTGPIEEIKK